MSRRLVAIVGSLALAATGSPAVAAASHRSCRPAVAHHAGGRLLHPQPPGGPIVCGMPTGFGGSESRVAVTKDGAVVFEPAVLTPGLAGTGFASGAPGPRPQTQASAGGLAVSKDDGRAWRFVKPAGTYWTPQDDQLYVDRRTGRIFW